MSNNTGGGGGGALAGQLCTDVLTKNDEKGYFFRVGQWCHHLG